MVAETREIGWMQAALGALEGVEGGQAGAAHSGECARVVVR
jgi:hypothetical protein